MIAISMLSVSFPVARRSNAMSGKREEEFLELGSVMGFLLSPVAPVMHSRSPVATILNPALSRARETAASWVTTSLQSRPFSIMPITPASCPCARRSRFSTSAMLSSSPTMVYFAGGITFQYWGHMVKDRADYQVLHGCTTGKTSSSLHPSERRPANTTSFALPCVRWTVVDFLLWHGRSSLRTGWCADAVTDQALRCSRSVTGSMPGKRS